MLRIDTALVSAINTVQRVNVPTLFQTENALVHFGGSIARIKRKFKS